MIDPILHFDHPQAAPVEHRILLVMLPGAGMQASEFESRLMVAAVREQSFPIDVIAAGPDMSLYLDGDIAAAIHRIIIEPALARGYRRIWLLGISLGGMGALLYASHHADDLEGLMLLAPFLGTQGTIAEIQASGGLASWQAASSSATTGERRLLLWLQDYLERPLTRPAIYLGYGKTDRFAAGHRFLADALPPIQVVTHPGGHDWDSWLPLGRSLFAAATFTAMDARL